MLANDAAFAAAKRPAFCAAQYSSIYTAVDSTVRQAIVAAHDTSQCPTIHGTVGSAFDTTVQFAFDAADFATKRATNAPAFGAAFGPTDDTAEHQAVERAVAPSDKSTVDPTVVTTLPAALDAAKRSTVVATQRAAL